MLPPLLLAALTGCGSDQHDAQADLADPDANYAIIDVFYGTNRNPAGRTGRSGFYGNKRGGLRYGISSVSVPRDHRIGAIERPRFWRFEFRENPDKHIVIHDCSEFTSRNDFVSALQSSLNGSLQDETFVFIHGFNVSFADAARRTAQMAHDLDFDVPIMFSWPSKGSLSIAGYRHDETNEEWMRHHLRDFLGTIAESRGTTRVHLIAHSMGTKATSYALQALQTDGRFTMPLFNQVVLAAPDIDADVFKQQIAPAIKGVSVRTTLYASADDKALEFSRAIHGHYPRAGYITSGPTIAVGVDTVDVSLVDASFVGHNFYGDNASVISDLYYLLHKEWPPENRHRLDAIPDSDKPRFWRFRP